MSNLYRLTDEQVRNYRDAVTYTAAQQPTTFVARDHDKLLDALSTPVSLPAPPEEMIALRDVLNKKYPVNNWQPVPATWEYAETKDDFVWTSTITSERNGTHITIEHTEGDEYERSVDLPEGYALCRLVTETDSAQCGSQYVRIARRGIRADGRSVTNAANHTQGA